MENRLKLQAQNGMQSRGPTDVRAQAQTDSGKPQAHIQMGFESLLGQLPAETPVLFFERLMRRLEQYTSKITQPSSAAELGDKNTGMNPAVKALDAKDQWLCFLGLRLLHNESKKSRFERDTVAIQATWNVIEPLLNDAGLVYASKADADCALETRDMLERFLANEPPLIQTLPRHQARALTRKKASRRRRLIAKELHQRKMEKALTAI